MVPKPGKLTLALLMGKGKQPPQEADEDMADSDEDENGSGESSDLPPGLLEAVSEFRSAATDEEAAKAFHNAMLCC